MEVNRYQAQAWQDLRTYLSRRQTTLRMVAPLRCEITNRWGETTKARIDLFHTGLFVYNDEDGIIFTVAGRQVQTRYGYTNIA